MGARCGHSTCLKKVFSFVFLASNFGRGPNLGSPHSKTVEAVTGRKPPIEAIAGVPLITGTARALKTFLKTFHKIFPSRQKILLSRQQRL